MATEIEEITDETVPPFATLVETFDTLMNEIPMGMMNEEHMIKLRKCWNQLKDSYQRMENNQTQGGSTSSARDGQMSTVGGFGSLLLSAAVHFGFSAAMPHFQGPQQKVDLAIINLVISVMSSISTTIIALIPLMNNEAKTLKDLWKQSLQEDGKYRSMVRVTAYLAIFIVRVAILIYSTVVKNKKKVLNFDLSCVPGLADCWSVYRELFKKKSQADVESGSLQHPSAAVATQHHSVTAVSKDQSAVITGVSDSSYGDQAADMTRGATQQHAVNAAEDQGVDIIETSDSDYGDQGVDRASDATFRDQGADVTGAFGAAFGDQGVDVAGPSDA